MECPVQCQAGCPCWVVIPCSLVSVSTPGRSLGSCVCYMFKVRGDCYPVTWFPSPTSTDRFRNVRCDRPYLYLVLKQSGEMESEPLQEITALLKFKVTGLWGLWGWRSVPLASKLAYSQDPPSHSVWCLTIHFLACPLIPHLTNGGNCPFLSW